MDVSIVILTGLWSEESAGIVVCVTGHVRLWDVMSSTSGLVWCR